MLEWHRIDGFFWVQKQLESGLYFVMIAVLKIKNVKMIQFHRNSQLYSINVTDYNGTVPILIAELLFRIKKQTVGLNTFNKPKGQLKMDNSATWATFHTAKTEKHSTKAKKEELHIKTQKNSIGEE